MSKIKVADARALAAQLTAQADAAEADGQTEFDLSTASLQAMTASSLEHLQTAIDALK